MDDAQIGSVFRAVRIRRGLSQEQVAVASGVCRSVVSLIERGGLEDTSVRSVRRVAVALGVSLTLVPRWRGADLAELLDEKHAAMVRGVVARLTARGWQTLPERTFSVWGERGAIDVLAWHAAEKALLCVEVKTRLPDLQDLLSTMDRKRRLAPGLVWELGWRPVVVGSVLTLPAETWELVCDSLDLDLREQVLGEVKSPKIEVSTSLVKTDLKAEIAVPGAKLAGGTYLVRK